MAILDYVLSAREIAGSLPINIVTQYTITADLLTSEYRAIQWAVKKYSELRPIYKTVAFLPTGVFEYDLGTLVPGWNIDQYKVREVIYPGNQLSSTYDIGVYSQNRLAHEDWDTVRDPLDSNKPKLRLLNGYQPGKSTTGQLYMAYTYPHAIDSVNDTILTEYPGDTEAFSYLVASRLLFIAATYYANLSDPTVNIAMIDNQSKSNTFMQRSRDARTVFNEHIDSRISPTDRLHWRASETMGGERFWYPGRLL